MSKPINFRNTTFLLLTTVIYIVGFLPLHSIMGDGASTFSLFPVALAGWLFGIWGGLLWSFILSFVSVALFLIVGDLPLSQILLSGGIPGFLGLVGIGIGSGWFRYLNEKAKKKLLAQNKIEVILKENELKYHSLFNNMVEGTAIDQIIYENGKPVDWIVLDINPAYEKILGASRAEAVGQLASKVYGSKESLEPFLKLYDQAYRTNQPASGQFHSIIGDRELNLNVTSLGENRVAVIFADISEQEKALKAEKEERRLSDALRTISSALNSSIQLDEVLNIILEHMGHITAYEAADIMLIEDGRLRIVRHRGYSERGLEQFVQNFNGRLDDMVTSRRMAANLQPIIISNTAVSKDWLTFPETAWIASYMGLPIIGKGEIIGVLNFASSQVNFFNGFPVDRLQPFTDQVAMAIENARTYQETQKRADRLSLINRIASGLTMPAELDEVERLAVDYIAEALNFDQVALALLTTDKQKLMLVADHPGPGNASVKGSIIPLENNPSMDFIIEHKSSFQSENAQEDPRLAPVQDLMKRRNIFSILIVPLIIRGEVIGTMGCDITTPSRKLMREEVDLAETLTNLVAGRIEQGRLLEIEKKRATELSMLYDTALAITGSYELTRLLEQIVERAAWLLDSTGGLLYLLEPENDVLTCKVSYNNLFDQVGTKLPIGVGAAGIVAKTSWPLIIPNYANWELKPQIFGEILEPFALLSVPVIWQSQVKGVIQIIRKEGKAPFESRDARLLELFSSQVAISLENTRLYEEVQQLAVHDPLTGLYNRRGFTEIGNREIERARRFKRPLSLLFLDLDHFKKVNDDYGHPAGDQILIGVADRCHGDLRNVDVIGRYGGEEFVILLLESNLGTSEVVAERVRSLIARNPFTTPFGVIAITVSIGVAEYHESIAGLDELIKDADQALYQAKSSGRNRFFTFHPA